MKKFSTACIIGSIALFGFAIYYACYPSAHSFHSLELSSESFDLQHFRAGEKLSIECYIKNISEDSIEIFGNSSSCSELGCVFVQTPVPCCIQPGENKLIQISIKGFGSGEFRQIVDLYTNSKGQEIINIQISGYIIP